MLVEFSVKNFRSFRDMATWSFEASVDSSLERNVLEDVDGTGTRLLRSCVLYGANASGKSNLLAALSFLRRMVLSSPGEGSLRAIQTVRPFKLDAACKDKPTTFEIGFVQRQVRYLYGFSIDRERVVEEWLYCYPKNRKRLLFDRSLDPNNSGEAQFRFGDSWKGDKKKLARFTRSDSLFISVAAQLNNPTASEMVKWFGSSSKFLPNMPGGGPPSEEVTLKLLSDNPDLMPTILAMLRNADLAIRDLDLSSRTVRESMELRGIPPDGIRQLETMIGDQINDEQLEPILYHRGLDLDGQEQRVGFERHEESDGTQRYFSILGPIYQTLATGELLLADELGSRLHPLLSRAIIDMFHDPDVNQHGAQLAFATHDVFLLSERNLFRRDQVWLAEKDDTGASSILSLWDYRPRKGENLAKGYLAGRYGGVPYIEAITIGTKI